MFELNQNAGIFARIAMVFGVVLLGMLSGCGGFEEDSYENQVRCREGAGQCYGSEMCVRGDCAPIAGRRFKLTVERGDMAKAMRYYAIVSNRNGESLLRTETTAKMLQPEWYESVTLTSNVVSDWWEITVKDSGIIFDDVIAKCNLPFDSARFETKSQLICGQGGPDQLTFTLQPL